MFDSRWGDDGRDRGGNARELSRGGRGGSHLHGRERVHPRDVFARHVDLPRGPEREHVYVRDREYRLRGSEARTLSTVGAFRVARVDDLRDTFGNTLDPRRGELWHLRESGLVRSVPLGRDATAVTLTKEGRDLLDSHRRMESGVRDHEVKEWLGHTNVTTTSRYLKTSGQRLQGAARMFERRKIDGTLTETPAVH